jgi:SNF2 family DNA or RNA helicase
VVDGAIPAPDGGWRLYVADADEIRPVALTADEVQAVQTLQEDGGGDGAAVLAGLWSEWMQRATNSSKATALASSPLDPYPHQNRAVYGTMLPQPLLRFLLADEPGTGKTIMGGLWLREAQRLGFVKRALIVVPAHLVTKWQADFDRFFGGDLRRITAETVRQGALATPHDAWIVSLELAAMNQAVYEAIHPDRAGWDAVIFDEAHRLTPTATQFHRVGLMLARSSPRCVLMTATPHRGNEWLFRALMHLVDPVVFPLVRRVDDSRPSTKLRPGPLHFLRRMKEELVDYDGATKLFLPSLDLAIGRESLGFSVRHRQGQIHRSAERGEPL